MDGGEIKAEMVGVLCGGGPMTFTFNEKGWSNSEHRQPRNTKSSHQDRPKG